MTTYAIEIPMASGDDHDGGWTIDPAFLRKIEEKTRNGEHVYMEGVEEVVLAIFNIPMNQKALPQEPQFG